MSKQSSLSEVIADNAADVFLKENVGSDIFIGSDVENLIAKTAQVIYQNIDDPKFLGALINYKDKCFVVLNTHQDLRARYYSAAHEMWHLALEGSMLGRQSEVIKTAATQEDFDNERAADHFAAALMLPEKIVVNTWYKYVQQQEVPNPALAKEAVVRIAEVSSMPYEAVCRRLDELHLLMSRDLLRWTREEWMAYLEQAGFPPSPLDNAANFKQFAGLSSFIKKQVDKGQMTLMEAANFLTNSDPKQAINYLKLRKEKAERQLSEDENG